MNHKRGRAKHQRAGCLLCKPHKDERLGKAASRRASVRRQLVDDEEICEACGGMDPEGCCLCGCCLECIVAMLEDPAVKLAELIHEMQVAYLEATARRWSHARRQKIAAWIEEAKRVLAGTVSA